MRAMWMKTPFLYTRVYNVPAAGDYTYYALAEIYRKKGGTGVIWVYGNLLVEYFPTEGIEKIFSQGFTLPLIDLNGEPMSFESIDVNAPAPESPGRAGWLFNCRSGI